MIAFTDAFDDSGPGQNVEVCLVNMPYAHVMRPSIALGILKSCLLREGICCHVEYANLRFAEAVGVGVNSLMMQLRTDSLVGEWTFAGAAFRDDRDTLNDLLGITHLFQPPNLPAGALDDREYATVFRQMRNFAPHFVDRIARDLLYRRPKIVGCTSTFEQHCAALALLRRVKELDPAVVTLIGGANCETSMGWATLRNCPWVDYAISGEADELMASFCRDLITLGNELRLDQLPQGVIAREHVLLGKARAFPAGKLPRAVLQRMDESPAPDFDEYFQRLETSALKEFITPALAVESSRGCWWGQKSHCTFCGLNGSGMNYRAKSSEVVLQEWQHLGRRYPTKKFTVVDNIIDLKHIRTLLPQLAAQGAPFELFYETKANLRREQVRLMAEAGVTKIQPGIEGLHDDLLHLMAKGNSAMINIQLLKFAREYGLMTTWMLLVGFPGENPQWHAEVAEWLPLVSHLQPPNGVVHVRFDRFSVYFNEPEKYGLDLRPFPAYALVYPFSEAELRDLAYFFYDANRRNPGEVHPNIRILAAEVQRWIIAFNRPVRPVFCVSDRDEMLEFFDTRPCAPARRVSIGGLARDIYLACDSAVTAAGLIAKFATDSASPDNVRTVIHELVEAKLLLSVHGHLLALACFGEVPHLRGQRDFPNGYVEKYDPLESRSATSTWRALRDGSPKLESLLREPSL